MKVIVDKRTEFIGIILMLSKYNQKYEFLKMPIQMKNILMI